MLRRGRNVGKTAWAVDYLRRNGGGSLLVPSKVRALGMAQKWGGKPRQVNDSRPDGCWYVDIDARAGSPTGEERGQ